MARPRSVREQRLHPDDWQFQSLAPWRGIRPAGITHAERFLHRRGHRVSGHDSRLSAEELRIVGLTACEACPARFYTRLFRRWRLFWCAVTAWEAHEITRQAMTEDEIEQFLRLDSHDHASVAT